MTDSAATASASSPCFDLKGAMLTFTVLELRYFDLANFEQTLREKIRQAPGFFKDLPVVISLDQFESPYSELDFFQLIGCCRRHSVQIAAVKGGTEDARRLARNASLAWLPSSGAKPVDAPTPAPAPESETPDTPDTPAATPTSAASDTATSETKTPDTRIVTQPVRSGQQIVASDGDLVILATVSAGAEIMAAGNIHVYGALRGRALAGIHGNPKARIFCQSLEAELVSIAGHYKISEDLQETCWKQPADLQLRDDQLTVSPLDRSL